MRAAAAVALGLAACGGGAGGDDQAEADASAEIDADVDAEGFTEIVGRDWTIPPGEHYKCVRVRVPRDMYITTFRAVAPLGTHHTVLTVAEGGQVGEYDCGAGSLDFQMLFASGVGTDDLTFPDGVAIKVTAGQLVNLNLHLFNTHPTEELSGHSGVRVRTIDERLVANEAEMVFAGDGDLNIPGNTGGVPHMETGGCTFSRDATLLAYWPHMHQYAVRQRVLLTVGGVETVVHDEAYSFEEQTNYPLAPPIQVGQGDSIAVECFYENETGTPVMFGDSSTTEMCFTGLYRYPKQAIYLFECTDGLGL